MQSRQYKFSKQIIFPILIEINNGIKWKVGMNRLNVGSPTFN